MVDGRALPDPIPWDDPRFDSVLDELTAHWEEFGNEGDAESDSIQHLASMPMGPGTAATFASLDNSTMSSRDRLTALKERVRVASHFQALIYEDMAAIADACEDAIDPELAWEAASSEIRAALRLTRRSADHELDMAVALRDRIPMVLAALRAGDIDQRRAATIVRGTAHLTVEVARVVAEEILPSAGRLTTGQLREKIRRLAMDVDPEDAAQRYRHASEQRRLEVEPTDDGTGNLLVLDAPPDRISAARRHVDRIARSLRSRDEKRMIDQLRADVALDLLSGALPAPHGDSIAGRARLTGGSVHLMVDLATLAGLDDRAGHLEGFGPVIADIARRVANGQHDSSWRFTVTDPDSGQPIATGATRRRPTAGQHRSVTAHHPTCIFPGCRAPAVDCDLDHRSAWSEGGPTSVDNLAPLCRHDHRLKHEHGWSLTRLDDGDHLWTSPLGQLQTTSGRSP